MPVPKKVSDLHAQFNKAYQANAEDCGSILSQLKLEIVQLGNQLLVADQDADVLNLSRDVFEKAAFLSVKRNDVSGFERNVGRGAGWRRRDHLHHVCGGDGMVVRAWGSSSRRTEGVFSYMQFNWRTGSCGGGWPFVFQCADILFLRSVRQLKIYYSPGTTVEDLLLYVVSPHQVRQLKIYYRDFANKLKASANEQKIFGLYLLSLLANDRIGEFHTELELISQSDSPFIQRPVQLEVGGFLESNPAVSPFPKEL